MAVKLDGFKALKRCFAWNFSLSLCASPPISFYSTNINTLIQALALGNIVFTYWNPVFVRFSLSSYFSLQFCLKYLTRVIYKGLNERDIEWWVIFTRKQNANGFFVIRQTSPLPFLYIFIATALYITQNGWCKWLLLFLQWRALNMKVDITVFSWALPKLERLRENFGNDRTFSTAQRIWRLKLLLIKYLFVDTCMCVCVCAWGCFEIGDEKNFRVWNKSGGGTRVTERSNSATRHWAYIFYNVILLITAK